MCNQKAWKGGVNLFLLEAHRSEVAMDKGKGIVGVKTYVHVVQTTKQDDGMKWKEKKGNT